MQIPAFTLLRIGAIPLAFAVNAMIGGEAPFAAASSLVVFAILGLTSAILPFTEGIAFGNLILGVSLSTADAFFPVLVLRTCQERHQTLPAGIEGSGPIGNENAAATTISHLRKRSLLLWSALRHACFLSIVFSALVVLVTGEARHIWNDSYVLDTTRARELLFFTGMLSGTYLVAISLCALLTSPVIASSMAVMSNAIQIAVFCHAALHVYNWLGLAACWFFGTCLIIAQLCAPSKGEYKSKEVASLQNVYAFLRIVVVTVALGVSITTIARISWDHHRPPICRMQKTMLSEYSPLQDFNLNSTARDDYLGARPHVDTVANLSIMLEGCEESIDGEGVDDVINCAEFLTHRSKEFLTSPVTGQGERASGTFIQGYEDLDAVKGVTAQSRNSPEPVPASISSIGTCSGPVFPFHVYWNGPASWRLELFVKAYLFTQNLPCSRLWIWLESDSDIDAVDRMLCDDPIFRRFIPLVERGDIVLKAWHFPKRIPIPAIAADNVTTLDLGNDVGIVQDDTIRWLLLHQGPSRFAPVQISDAVRFIVLHLHGGVYLDMDVMLLRDMRPLLLQPHAFAEQWVERSPPSDYNTAVLSLRANSSLSTYLVRGGVRMGMNFHPKAIGRMLWRDGRSEELAKLHNTVFDPSVTNLRRKGTVHCTVPCHKNFQQVFKAEVEEQEKEWIAYSGEEPEREMDKFFRGSFAYHIHNQVSCFLPPRSPRSLHFPCRTNFHPIFSPHPSRSRIFNQTSHTLLTCSNPP